MVNPEWDSQEWHCHIWKLLFFSLHFKRMDNWSVKTIIWFSFNDIFCGVPEESILRHLLFLLYINDLRYLSVPVTKCTSHLLILFSDFLFVLFVSWKKKIRIPLSYWRNMQTSSAVTIITAGLWPSVRHLPLSGPTQSQSKAWLTSRTWMI